MTTGIIYLENVYLGQRTSRINGLDETVWYDNFYGEKSKTTKVTIKSGSLLSKAFNSIGKKGNLWFNKSNWSFEIENEDYFTFSHGTYAVIYDKDSQEYFRVVKQESEYRMPHGINDGEIPEEKLKKILKIRKKRGQRII